MKTTPIVNWSVEVEELKAQLAALKMIDADWRHHTESESPKEAHEKLNKQEDQLALSRKRAVDNAELRNSLARSEAKRAALREALLMLQRQFAHSSSCNLSPFVNLRSRGCNCGTDRPSVVSIAKAALAADSEGEE
jgi:hypothetical protein